MTIKVSRHTKHLSNGEEFITYNVSPELIEFQLALNAIAHWENLKSLVEFAISRHGYGNTDSMCGITYESDLDDYDREIENVLIPIGQIQAYSDHFEVKEKNITEVEYLMILKSFFEANYEFEFAKTINNEIQKKKTTYNKT
ncbi:hypothetical protein [Tenacibaculum sp. SDUM215027]|uniref:hypothetical protein n=1 Tax=Tenacibaculum sp. SDUM215027 TaxID=3422596 RepID=UPI003D320D14